MSTEERLARLEAQFELLQSQLATKADIANLHEEIDSLRTEIGNSFARVLVTLGEIQTRQRRPFWRR